MTEPIKIEVTVDLDKALAGRARRVTRYDSDGGPYDDVVEDPATIEDVVLDAVVERIVADVTSDRELYGGMRGKVAELRDEILARLLEPLLVEAIEKTVQPTNKLGEGTCEPVTLSDVIIDRGQRWLGEGDPRSSSGYGPKHSRLQGFINEALDHAFRTELQKAVNEGKAQVLAVIRDQAADFLAKAMEAMATGKKG